MAPFSQSRLTSLIISNLYRSSTYTKSLTNDSEEEITVPSLFDFDCIFSYEALEHLLCFCDSHKFHSKRKVVFDLAQEQFSAEMDLIRTI